MITEVDDTIMMILVFMIMMVIIMMMVIILMMVIIIMMVTLVTSAGISTVGATITFGKLNLSKNITNYGFLYFFMASCHNCNEYITWLYMERPATTILSFLDNILDIFFCAKKSLIGICKADSVGRGCDGLDK